VEAPRAAVGTGALFGLAAAALFGLSAPLAKLLLPQVGVLLLAGLLYLGAALGTALYGLVSGRARGEAALRAADLPTLLGVMALGGVAGPVLMLFGLSHLSAVAGALLLNLEAPFTILCAVALFGEHLERRAGAGALAIVAGALALALGPGDWRADWLGVAAIAGACACWALDNNLTQRLSLRDPVAIARWKALGAGSFTAALALATGSRWPGPGALAAALAVGAVCYGLSVVLAVRSLRLLGAAREAAFFATAPFLGALAALPLLRDPLRPAHALAALLMASGVAALLRERHSHLHAHQPLEHDHVHVHDEHHRHAHAPGQSTAEPHAHPHRHEPLVHEHPHVSDLHHRHSHGERGR